MYGKLIKMWIALLFLIGLTGCALKKPLSFNFALGTPPVVNVELAVDELGVTLEDGAFARGGLGVGLNPLAVGKILFPKADKPAEPEPDDG